jgi:hypothetical protein
MEMGTEKGVSSLPVSAWYIYEPIIITHAIGEQKEQTALRRQLPQGIPQAVD